MKWGGDRSEKKGSSDVNQFGSMGLEDPVPMLDANTCWFLGAGLLIAAAAAVGVVVGRGSAAAARASIGAAVAWMLGWAWLVHHPDVALQFLPVELLSRVEGFGGVPAFMYLLGVLWSRTRITRQRALVVWAAAFGGVYFVNGGLWLLQDTPASVMGHSLASSGVVLQTQDYSCVPASCATALNLLGMPSTEAQLARLTDTRPGTGATVLRALRGLNERLAGSALEARLLGLTAQEVQIISLPALTPLQYEPGRRHMVVILARSRGGVWLMDPMHGVSEMAIQHFHELFTGQVIVFDGALPGNAGLGSGQQTELRRPAALTSR